jgi:hypothetical protein
LLGPQARLLRCRDCGVPLVACFAGKRSLCLWQPLLATDDLGAEPDHPFQSLVVETTVREVVLSGLVVVPNRIIARKGWPAPRPGSR